MACFPICRNWAAVLDAVQAPGSRLVQRRDYALDGAFADSVAGNLVALPVCLLHNTIHLFLLIVTGGSLAGDFERNIKGGGMRTGGSIHFPVAAAAYAQALPATEIFSLTPTAFSPKSTTDAAIK